MAMAKIEYNQGDLHILLETTDDVLSQTFERILNLVKAPQKVAKAPVEEVKPPRREAKAPAVKKPKAKGKKKAVAEKPAVIVEKPVASPNETNDSYKQFVDGFVKLSKPEAILAFAEWYGKPFSSKEYCSEPLNDPDQLNFFQRLNVLKRGGKVDTISKGVYRINSKGRQALDKKRKPA